MVVLEKIDKKSFLDYLYKQKEIFVNEEFMLSNQDTFLL